MLYCWLKWWMMTLVLILNAIIARILVALYCCWLQCELLEAIIRAASNQDCCKQSKPLLIISTAESLLWTGPRRTSTFPARTPCRPRFTNSLFPHWVSRFLSQNFVHQPSRPRKKLRRPRRFYRWKRGLRKFGTARTSTSRGALIIKIHAHPKTQCRELSWNNPLSN